MTKDNNKNINTQGSICCINQKSPKNTAHIICLQSLQAIKLFKGYILAIENVEEIVFLQVQKRSDD